MEQNFALESKQHRLYMKLKDIMDGGTIKEDKHSADAFTSFANCLISQFNCISDQPFRIELREIDCSEERICTLVEVASINDNGDDAFDMNKAEATHIAYRQSYLAQHLNMPEKGYVGVLVVEVWMPHPASSDGDAVPVENPLAQILADLVYMQYYRTISQEFRDWRTEYVDAPTVQK